MVERLGPFRVLNDLGQGGMGHVYHAGDRAFESLNEAVDVREPQLPAVLIF